MRTPTIYVIDDDEEIRSALESLFEVAGYAVECFASAQSFLDAERTASLGCVIIDLRLPDMDGLQLQSVLPGGSKALPIIFLSVCGDIPSAVMAMRNGAKDFLIKPINGKLLLARVAAVIADLEAEHRLSEEQGAFIELFRRLSERERHILRLAVKGRNNKEIACELDLSYRTVENHRSRIFLKTGVQNLLEMMQKSVRLEVSLQKIL
jgi:two-component system response regulator FixJ